MAFYIFARFQAREGAEKDLVKAFREMLPPVRAEAGCLGIDVFEATRVTGVFYIHSSWTDEDAFDRHAEMPHTVRFLKHAQPLLTHELEVTRARKMQ